MRKSIIPHKRPKGYKKFMWIWIDKTVNEFRKCFSRHATFCCFALILVGLMIRSDQLGITSIVRELSLIGNNYASLNHFFRSTAWFIGDFRHIWLNIVKASPFLIKEDERVILIGDGVQASKEGRKVPGVKSIRGRFTCFVLTVNPLYDTFYY